MVLEKLRDQKQVTTGECSVSHMIWVAQEVVQLWVSQRAVLVPTVKVDVSGGLLLFWYFLDADTLVPCRLLAEPCTENLLHEVLTALPLREYTGSVFLVDAKAHQRHHRWVTNAVFGTQTSCSLAQLLVLSCGVLVIDMGRGGRSCHQKQNTATAEQNAKTTNAGRQCP